MTYLLFVGFGLMFFFLFLIPLLRLLQFLNFLCIGEGLKTSYEKAVMYPIKFYSWTGSTPAQYRKRWKNG